MTDTNGHTNGNGKAPRKWWGDASREVAGFGIAEVASAAVSIGVFTLADDIAPHLMQKAGSVIGRVCVEPFLDQIEWAMQKTCKLKECQPDPKKSREERAESYGRFITRFGVSLVPALLTEYAVRKVANHLLEVGNGHNHSLWHKLKHPTKHDLGVLGTDKIVQVGGIIGVNTIFAKQADNGIEAVSSMLQQSLGWHKDRADRAADALIIWHLADGLGFAAASGEIFLHHYNKRSK